MFHSSLELLESRIAPAATITISAKFIMTIDADAAGDDLDIVQGMDGLIDVLDKTNMNTSLMQSGMPEKVLGIIYKGGTANDRTHIKLQNGILTAGGLIESPSLPEGLVYTEIDGENVHSIEAAVDFATIGKKFSYLGGAGKDSLSLTDIGRVGDFTFTGDVGEDTLTLNNSSISGKVNINTTENLVSAGNGVFGPVTINNAANFLTTSNLSLNAELITGAVKYTGSTDPDAFAVDAVVMGAITMLGKEGNDSLEVSTYANAAVSFTGGDGDDTMTIDGVVAGAVTFLGKGGNNSLTLTGSALKALTYTGGAGDDTLTINGLVGGALTMKGNEGKDSLDFTGVALKAISFTGGTGDDSLKIDGTVLGAITGNMGTGGANTVNIQAQMAGSAITLTGGTGVDTFTVLAVNAGALNAKLGAGADVITTGGVFKSLNLDAGPDSGMHNGAEATFGKLTRKNFL